MRTVPKRKSSIKVMGGLEFSDDEDEAPIVSSSGEARSTREVDSMDQSQGTTQQMVTSSVATSRRTSPKSRYSSGAACNSIGSGDCEISYETVTPNANPVTGMESGLAHGHVTQCDRWLLPPSHKVASPCVRSFAQIYRRLLPPWIQVRHLSPRLPSAGH